jgi:hypothetical protein
MEQLEEENVDEIEDTLIRIICGQSFAHYGTEEELTVQLGFVSAIRCHDPLRWNCYTTMLRCFATFKWYKNLWSSRIPHQLHEYTLYEFHVGVLFAVTCNRQFESLFFIENLSIECYLNFILRHIVK